MSDRDIEIVAHTFEHHFEEHNYRRVSVSVDLGDNSDLSIDEQYDPAIEDADKVIARLADDLILLLKRRGRA